MADPRFYISKRTYITGGFFSVDQYFIERLDEKKEGIVRVGRTTEPRIALTIDREPKPSNPRTTFKNVWEFYFWPKELGDWHDYDSPDEWAQDTAIRLRVPSTLTILEIESMTAEELVEVMNRSAEALVYPVYVSQKSGKLTFHRTPVSPVLNAEKVKLAGYAFTRSFDRRRDALERRLDYELFLWSAYLNRDIYKVIFEYYDGGEWIPEESLTDFYGPLDKALYEMKLCVDDEYVPLIDHLIANIKQLQLVTS